MSNPGGHSPAQRNKPSSGSSKATSANSLSSISSNPGLHHQTSHPNNRHNALNRQSTHSPVGFFSLFHKNIHMINCLCIYLA